mmetsp:Transcript_23693/g.60992  ORF Transcript_23693/g.60992 Transcript_23693/m.60992 type:complete len:242 (-) Transcript_23693:215-940(-)
MRELLCPRLADEAFFGARDGASIVGAARVAEALVVAVMAVVTVVHAFLDVARFIAFAVADPFWQASICACECGRLGCAGLDRRGRAGAGRARALGGALHCTVVTVPLALRVEARLVARLVIDPSGWTARSTQRGGGRDETVAPVVRARARVALGVAHAVAQVESRAAGRAVLLGDRLRRGDVVHDQFVLGRLVPRNSHVQVARLELAKVIRGAADEELLDADLVHHPRGVRHGWVRAHEAE